MRARGMGGSGRNLEFLVASHLHNHAARWAGGVSVGRCAVKGARSARKCLAGKDLCHGVQHEAVLEVFRRGRVCPVERLRVSGQPEEH